MMRNTSIKLLLLFPLLLISLFVAYLGINLSGHFLQYIDGSVFLHKSEANSSFGYFWEENNFGNRSLVEVTNFYPRAFSYLLLNAGLSTVQMELLLIFLSLVLAFYSSWLFQHLTLKTFLINQTLWPSFIGSMFFTFNVMMVMIWGGGIGDAGFIFIGCIPAFFYYFLKLVFKRLEKREVLLLGIFFGINSNIIPFNIALIGVLFVSLIVLRAYNNKIWYFGKEFLRWISIGVISMLTGAFLIVPTVILFLFPDPYAVTNPFESFLFSQQGISGLFRFFYFWSISLARDGIYAFPLFKYFNNRIIGFSAIILWIILTSSTYKYFNKKRANINPKEKSFLLFSWLIILISTFVAKGDQSPLGGINILLYRYIPLFGLFRTPDTKFGLPIIVALSFLISYSFSKITSSRIKFILVTTVFLQVFPFFSSKNFIGSEAAQKKVFFPNEYAIIANMINQDPSEGALVFYPGNQIGKFQFASYNQDLLGRLIDRPVIYSTNTRITPKAKDIVDHLFANLDYKNPGEYSIRYVVLRKDIINDLNDFNLVLDKIFQNPTLEIIANTSVASTFRLKTNAYYEDIAFAHISGKKYPITINKLNPSHYQFIFNEKLLSENSQGSVVFRNNFHPLWKLSSQNEKIRVGKHTLFENYANEWEIEIFAPGPELHNHEIKLDMELDLQKYSKKSKLVSTFSLIFSILSLSYLTFYKKKP